MLRECREGGVRTELDVAGDSPGLQGAHVVGEPDGVADVRHPVGGARRIARGDERNRRFPEGERRDLLPELLEHRLHQGRVERVTHLEPGGAAAEGGEHLLYRERVLLRTRDHSGVGCVERGDGQPRRQVREQLLLGGLDGDHRPACRKTAHQASPDRDEPCRVTEVEHPGRVRGGDLADRVPRHVVGDDPPVLQGPVQRGLQGEQGGLRVVGPVQQVRVLSPHHVPQRPVEMRVERGERGVESGGEHRFRGVEFAPHVQTLAALAGEEVRGAASGRGAAGQTGRFRALGERGEAGEERVAAGGVDDRPVLEPGPGRKRDGGIPDGRLGTGDGVRVQPARLVAQRFPALRRQEPGERCGIAGPGRGGGLGVRLLEDDVRVGATDPEGGDGRPARFLAGRPGPRPVLGEEPYGAVRPVDVIGRLVHVQRPGQHPVVHRHDHLDHATDTRRGLGMSDVRLQRAEPQRMFWVPFAAVGVDEGLCLDGVAEPGPGAVSLDRVHLGRGEPGVGQGLPDHPLLRRAVRGRETVACAVLVGGRAPYDGQDRMAVAPGVGEPLQKQQTDAFAPARAVGRGGEGLAAAVGRQPPLTAELHEGPGRGHHRRAARQRQRALTLPQRLRRQVQRHQRRRARRVDCDRRTLEPVRVGDPPRHHAAGVAGQQNAFQVLRHVLHRRRVVVVHRAGEHTGVAAPHIGRVDAGPLERLPGRFEEEPLLRVHRRGLAWADPEELGVELARPVEETALVRAGPADGLGIGVVQVLHVPAAVPWEGAHGVGPLGDQAPQVLG